MGSKSCENGKLDQTVDFVKIELSCTRELNFRGPRRSKYHQNVNLVVLGTWSRLGSCYLGGLKGGKRENGDCKGIPEQQKRAGAILVKGGGTRTESDREPGTYHFSVEIKGKPCLGALFWTNLESSIAECLTFWVKAQALCIMTRI